MAELTDSLYLCSAVALRSANLTSLGVTCVINATAELPDTPLPNDNIVYVKIPVIDRINSDLVQHFDTVSDLIQEVKLSYIFEKKILTTLALFYKCRNYEISSSK